MTFDHNHLFKAFQQIKARGSDFREWAQEMKEAETELELKQLKGGHQLLLLKDIISAMEANMVECWIDEKNGATFIVLPNKLIAE